VTALQKLRAEDPQNRRWETAPAHQQRLEDRELRIRLTSGANLKVSRTCRDRLDRWLSGK